jgi:hypothetical protein
MQYITNTSLWEDEIVDGFSSALHYLVTALLPVSKSVDR